MMIHMRTEFLLLAMDQIINHAAKWHYMFAGQLSVLECAVEAPAMPALELAAAPEFTAGAAASSLVAEDLMPAPAPKGNGKGKGKNKSRTIAA
jgi:hypothetical protein